jgi:sulfide:quinone oxidoreductase
VRIGQLSEHFFVSGQIEPEHVAQLADQGFRTILCNRPDGEELRQPTAGEIAAAADEHGMKFVHIPVLSSGIQPQNVEDFKAQYNDLEAPILAYCRSGARSAMLFQRAGVE